MQFNLARHNKHLISLMIPLVIEQVLRISMGNINIFFLGSYSDNAVASVGVANQFINMGQMLLTLVASGSAVVISQYLGADDRRKANATCLVTIILGSIMGAFVCPLFAIFPRQFLSLIGIGEELMPHAVTYLRVVGGTLFLHGIFAVFSSICRCYRRPKLPMYGILLMNIFNIAGTALVVFGNHPEGMNVVLAVACVNAIAAFLGLLFVVIVTIRYIKISFSLKLLRPFPISLARDVLRIGLPGGVESISYNLSQIVTTSMIVSLGVTAISAKTYLGSIVVYIYVLGMCLGQAGQLIVAQLVGGGRLNEASAFVRRNIRYNLTLNIGISLIVILLRYPIAGLLTQNREIINLICRVLLIDIIVQSGRAFSHCFNVSLRAVGDVRFTMLLMLLSTWVISVPISYILAVRLRWGLYGIWTAFALDESFRGAAACYRWCRDKWRPLMQRRLADIGVDEII